jgi:CRP/FNR family transcriptional regulator, cyclic AMP receptor protein
MRWRLLESLSETDAREVLAASIRRKFDRKEVLFHEDDPGDSLLMIGAGRVLVRVTTPLGEPAVLDLLGPGDVLGEMALIGDARRSATAVALEPVEAMSVDRASFDRLRAKHPAVGRALEQILAERLRRTSAQLMEAMYLNADVRVLRRLVRLSEIYGNGDGKVTIPLNQEELAGLAGTTRVTVNRVLQGEVERGTLELGRGKVTVLDPSTLAKRARG